MGCEVILMHDEYGELADILVSFSVYCTLRRPPTVFLIPSTGKHVLHHVKEIQPAAY